MALLLSRCPKDPRYHPLAFIYYYNYVFIFIISITTLLGYTSSVFSRIFYLLSKCLDIIYIASFICMNLNTSLYDILHLYICTAKYILSLVFNYMHTSTFCGVLLYIYLPSKSLQVLKIKLSLHF